MTGMEIPRTGPATDGPPDWRRKRTDVRGSVSKIRDATEDDGLPFNGEAVMCLGPV